MTILRKQWLIFSIVLGGLFSICSYCTWLPGYFPLESLRLTLASVGAFFLETGITYFVLTRMIVPGLKNLAESAKYGFLITCFFFGLFLFLSTVDFNFLTSRYVYFLLPRQKLEVNVTLDQGNPNQKMTLRGFSTAIRKIGLTQLETTGWKRVEDTMVFDNSQGNKLEWTGMVGSKTVLLFETSPGGGEAVVSWNGISKTFSLYSEQPGTIQIKQEFEVPFYASWALLALILLIIFSMGICAILLMLIRGQGHTVPVQIRRFEWILYALPMDIIWGFYLLVFFPGFLSGDSISQWRQMTTVSYTDWQPPFHTMTNWVLTRIWYSPAAVGIFQIIFLSCILGWGLSVLRRMGSPAWLTWGTAAFLAISPANSIYAITLWKDILYSIYVVILTVFILQIIRSKGEWLQMPVHWVTLGIVLAMVSVYRQNGDFVAAGVLTVLILSFRHYWKKLLLSLLMFMSLLGLIRGVLFKSLNVMPIDMARSQIVLFNLAAAHQDHGTYFTPGEQNLVTGGFPEAHLPYVCSRNTGLTSILEQTYLYRSYLINHSSQIVDLAKNLTIRSPMVTIKHFLCNGAFVYRMFQYLPYYETGYLSVLPNIYGIKTNSLLPGIKPFLATLVIKTTDQYGINWLVWRSPFWMFLLALGIIGVCFRRKTWLYLLVLVPALLSVLPLIFLSFGQIFRYVYPMYLCGILLSGYFLYDSAHKPVEIID